jgi:hypothetical protein
MGMLVHGPTKHPEIPVPWAPNGFNWDWPMELDSWTWPGPDDVPLGVRVFARGCESVQLRLNDTAIDKAPVLANLTATFIVPYKKGKLEALCVNGSTIVPGISAALYTAGDPAALVLTVDRSTIQHDVKGETRFVRISAQCAFYVLADNPAHGRSGVRHSHGGGCQRSARACVGAGDIQCEWRGAPRGGGQR